MPGSKEKARLNKKRKKDKKAENSKKVQVKTAPNLDKAIEFLGNGVYNRFEQQENGSYRLYS